MPIVETSVAVATPSITAARMTNGKAMAGSAMTKARAISRAGAFVTCDKSSPRLRRQTTTQRTAPTTRPGSSPPVKRAAMDTPVTDPTVISTRLGGIVSVCAPVADNSATNSPGFEPRACISGNSAGAIAAMSAALEPEIPDTKYMAPIKT